MYGITQMFAANISSAITPNRLSCGPLPCRLEAASLLILVLGEVVGRRFYMFKLQNVFGCVWSVDWLDLNVLKTSSRPAGPAAWCPATYWPEVQHLSLCASQVVPGAPLQCTLSCLQQIFHHDLTHEGWCCWQAPTSKRHVKHALWEPHWHSARHAWLVMPNDQCRLSGPLMTRMSFMWLGKSMQWMMLVRFRGSLWSFRRNRLLLTVATNLHLNTVACLTFSLFSLKQVPSCLQRIPSST